MKSAEVSRWNDYSRDEGTNQHRELLVDGAQRYELAAGEKIKCTACCNSNAKLQTCR